MWRISDRQWGKKECPCLDSLPAGLHGFQAVLWRGVEGGGGGGREGGKKSDDWRTTGVSLEGGKVPGVGHGE